MGIDMERKGEIVGDLDWDGLHRPRIYYAMVATFSGLFLAVLDGTICNVALPSISEDLQVSSSDSIWIINAFQLVIMMSLLPFSSLGELFGYKRIYLFGVAVFTVGSLFCSLTATLPLLVVARVFQGIGAAMIMSVNTSLVRIIYPKRHLGKGVGLNATVVAIASVAGPTLAAAILSVASWPWLFAINVPVGIITFYLGRKYLPANPTRVLGRRFKFRVTHRLYRGLFARCLPYDDSCRGGLPAFCRCAVCAYAVARQISDVAVRFIEDSSILSVGRNQCLVVYFANAGYGCHALFIGQYISL